MAKLGRLTAFVDGAARGNPGPSSVGVVLQDEKKKTLKNISVALGHSTNNVAEYSALIFAMQEALMMGAQELQVFTDSELVAKQWSGEYKIKDASLRVLYLLASHLKGGFKKLSVTHVPREQNKLADEQANLALDKPDLFA